MSGERRNSSRAIAVAVRIGDAALRERLALEIAGTPGLVWSEAIADVLVTDAVGSEGDAAGPVVLIGDVDPETLSPTVRALLPADAGPRMIASTARLVAEGLLVLPDGALERWPAIASEAADDGGDVAPPSAELTPREKEVLQLLAAGASNKAIARHLDVSVHTVKFHVASLFRKLGASGRLEAVGIGLRTGLLMI